MQKTFSFQPFTTEFARDPYVIYKQMRDEHPIYYYKKWDMFLLSTYEDILTLVNDPRLVRSLEHVMTEAELAVKRQAENWPATPDISRYVRVNILDSEGELHDRLRNLVFRIFTPKRVNALRGSVQALVDERLSALVGKGKMDFIEDFVAPIPGFVIGKLLGVATQDRSRLRQWSEHIVQFFEPERTDADIQKAEEASGEFAEYLVRLAEQRRESPEDDLISELLVAEAQARLSRDELISTCMIILIAGHGSTIDASGNGMLALLQHRQEMEKLRAQPALIQSAVQEMFRYDPPLPFFHRLALEDIEYKGHFFPKGTKFGVLYASANRDPARFSRPDDFDVSRTPNRHLAFGTGAHFCLGNHLARLNMDIMFTTLLQRLPDIAPAVDEAEYRIGLSSRGLKSLPITWSQ